MADEQKPLAEPENQYERGYIKAARRDNKVALWDRHPQHPDGEIYVADGSPPVMAAFTPEVERAIADGRVVRTNESDVRAFEARAAEREEDAAKARDEALHKMATQGAVMPNELEPESEKKNAGPGRPRNAP